MEVKLKKFELNYLLFFFLVFTLFYCNPVHAIVNNEDAGLNNFLVISDIHLISSSPPPTMEINPHGSFIVNNMDNVTFPDLLQKIQDGVQNGTVPNPKFIIFLGDLVGNYLPFNSAVHIIHEQAVFTQLKNKFSGIPIFYVFGNHDSTREPNGPFYNDDPTVQYKSPYQVAKASGWADGFLSTGIQCSYGSSFSQPCLIDENTQYGYYSAYVQEKLRLIVLNTTMLWTEAADTSADGVNAQFTWLEEQLQNAQDNRESVLLAMHVPFGNFLQNATPVNYLEPNYNNNFLTIIAKYNNIIIGMVAGHEHLEELKVLTENNKPVNFLINVPAMVTYSGNAPAFDTVYLQNTPIYRTGSNWKFFDYDAFYFLGTGVDENTPLLQKLYSFNNAYCDGLATSVLDCFQKISVTKLVDTMNFYHTAGNPNFSLNLANPDNIFTALPASTPEPRNNSNHHFGTAAIIAGAAATVGIGALIIEEKTSLN